MEYRLRQTYSKLVIQRWHLSRQPTEASLEADIIVINEQIETIKNKLASYEQDCLFNKLTVKNPKVEMALDKGYFYCPYVPMVRKPIIAEEFTPRTDMLKTYGKKLMEEGSKYYSKMKIVKEEE